MNIQHIKMVPGKQRSSQFFWFAKGMMEVDQRVKNLGFWAFGFVRHTILHVQMEDFDPFPSLEMVTFGHV